MLAMLTKTPELQIEHVEAEALSKAMASVASHYDVGASVAPEVLAWMSLVQTAALVYGPRIFALRRRRADMAGQTMDHNAQAGPGAMEGMMYQ